MELVAFPQKAPIFVINHYPLIWNEIFNYLIANDRHKLRRVCRAWRDIVDNFKHDHLHVMHEYLFQAQLSNYDLFPHYKCQANQNGSGHNEIAMSYKHVLRPRQPKMYEIFILKSQTKSSLDAIGCLNRWKSLVFCSRLKRITINSELTLKHYKSIENLEFHHENWSFTMEDVQFPRLTRLVAFGSGGLKMFQQCPNLKVLKIGERALDDFREDIKWLHSNKKVSGLRKLHIHYSWSQHEFVSTLMDLNAFLVLPHLQKLTIVLSPEFLIHDLPDNFPFYRVPLVSIRLAIFDHQWEANLRPFRSFVSIIQAQLELYSFKVKINGHPFTSTTNVEQLQNYLINFLDGSQIDNEIGLDADSADRFRCSYHFKHLTVEDAGGFLNINKILKWNFLNSLELERNVSQLFLQQLPKRIPLLQELKLALLRSTEDSDPEYDLSFIFEFKHLRVLDVRNLKLLDPGVLRKAVTDIRTLEYLSVHLKLAFSLYVELCELLLKRNNQKLTWCIKAALGQRKYKSIFKWYDHDWL